MPEIRHWPWSKYSAATLCNDQAWTRYFATDAADITCARCEAELYRPHSPAALARAIARELPPL